MLSNITRSDGVIPVRQSRSPLVGGKATFPRVVRLGAMIESTDSKYLNMGGLNSRSMNAQTARAVLSGSSSNSSYLPSRYRDAPTARPALSPPSTRDFQISAASAI